MFGGGRVDDAICAPSHLVEFEFPIKSDPDFDFNATFYTDIINL
jgi:hypothetical protein